MITCGLCSVRLPVRLATSLVLVSAMLSAVAAEEVEYADLRNGVCDANDPYELNEAYLSIRKASSPELRDLKSGLHEGIALQAAWEEVRRQVPIPHVPDMVKWAKGKRSRVERFVGFLEGRLKVPIPEWWETLLVEQTVSSAEPGGYVFLRIRPKKSQAFYKEAKIDPSEKHKIWMPFDVHLKDKSDDQLIVSVNKRQITVPRVIDRPWGINATPIDDRRWLVVLHNEAYADGTLMCLTESDNKELWHSEIWGEVQFGFRRGMGYFHWVDFRVRDNTAYLFGVTAQVIYVEGFSLTDGACRFRFSTSYGVDLRAE